MSHSERGLYILALCLQWTQGSVTKDEITTLGRAMAQPSLCRVLAKFEKGDDGRLRNARMEFEREKQAEYRKNRRDSGKTGAEKRWHSHSTAIAQPIANGSSPSPTPFPSPIRGGEVIPPSDGKLGTSERISLERSLERGSKRLEELKDADLPAFVEERRELKADKKRLLGLLGLKA